MDYKKNHFVQEEYLKGFTTEEGRLWQMRKLPQRQAKFFGPRLPSQVAAENKLYWKQRDVNPTHIEQTLTENIEPPGMAAISRLLNREQLDTQGRHDLARYLGVQFTRVPKFRDHLEVRDRERRQGYYDRLPERLDRLGTSFLGIENKQFVEWVNAQMIAGSRAIDEDPEFIAEAADARIDAMIKLGKDFGATLETARLEVIHLPAPLSLITNDNPVQVDRGGEPESSFHFFPLSRSCMLQIKRSTVASVYHHEGSEQDREWVGQANRTVVSNAYREAYGETRQVLEQAVSDALNKPGT